MINSSSRTLLDKISAPDDFRLRYLRRSESRRRTVHDVHGRYPMLRHGPTGVCRKLYKKGKGKEAKLCYTPFTS